MAVQLFRLRGVPDDEREEVFELLTEHGFDFYETPAGLWGISMPAFWLKDDSQLVAAKALIAEYQQQRLVRMQAEAQATPPPKFWQHLLRQPLQVVVYAALILLVLYISVMPFVKFG